MKSIIEEAYKLPSTYWVRTEWAKKVANGKPTDFEHLYYLLLLGVVAKKPESNEKLALRLKLAFQPVQNENKLANGRFRYDTLKVLLNRLRVSSSYKFNSTPMLGVDEYTHKLVQKKAVEVYSLV